MNCGASDYSPMTLVGGDYGEGESLTMYRHGISEALRPGTGQEEEQFTRERLHRHVRTASGSREEIGDALIRDVQQFIGSASQTDDIRLVCLGRI